MTQVVEIMADAYENALKEADKPVVVEFWIKSCPNCQKFKPVYEKLPETFSNKIAFLKMNMFSSLANLKLAEGLGVEDTPTLKLFCKGREIRQIVGYRPLEQVVSEINEMLEPEPNCHEQGHHE
jgi:thioredoxin 1